MAENKRAFVLYTDLIHTVKQLTNEKAGKLFKHILSYVNDENPVTEDLILKIAFEPIKQQLKRDLKKYEQKKIQWSNAGKASAEAKKQRTLTDVQCRSTDSTVIVKDTVKVKVKDKVINIIYPFNTENFLKFWDYWKEYKNKEFNFKYKSEISEQAALKNLGNISNQDEETAIKIIMQSIENSYKGLFKLKTDGNKQKTSNKGATKEELAWLFAKKFATDYKE